MTSGDRERGPAETPSGGSGGAPSDGVTFDGTRESLSAPARARLLTGEVLRDVRGKKTSPRSSARHLDAAIEWIYTAQDATGSGGCASVYNLVLGWGGPYPETTGYIVPTLYDYAKATDSPTARERAEAMSEWLLSTQFDHGGFPAGDDPKTETRPSVFNSGQILFGLVRAYGETGEERYREAARDAGQWLVSVQHEGGYWDRYDYNDAVHSYSARVASGLLTAAEATGEDSFREAAAANLHWVADQSHGNGWFDHCGFEPGSDPFLHTIAYTVRGLLDGGLALDDEEIFGEARRSADALLDVRRRDGVLRGQYDADMRPRDFYCLTGNAQMAIVWYILYRETGEQRYREAADDAVEFLKTRQRMDGPAVVRGGLRGSDPVWGPYMYLRYPNWASKFLADALLLAERYEPSGP